MGATTAEYAVGSRGHPRPETIGCPPRHFAATNGPGAGVAANGESSDAELAMALQLAEMQEADASAAHAAEVQHESMQMMLSDPVWGDLHFPGKDPTSWDKTCFGCCPCFVVGCTGRRSCCLSGHATPSMNPMRIWKRVLSCSSLWISVVQVAIFILVVMSSSGFVPMDQNQMIGPHPHYLDKVGAKNTAKMLLRNEWWRLISPLLLHGGVLHLLMNVLVQLRFGML